MPLELRDIWLAASVLVGFQLTALRERIRREIDVSHEGDITWLPPAELWGILALVAAVFVFIGPMVWPTAPLNWWTIALSLSALWTVCHGLVLAAHYDLLAPGPRSMAHFTTQEKVASGTAAAATIAYLVVVLI